MPEGQNIDFGALRDFGSSNKLDYAAYFKSPQGVFGTIASRLAPALVKPGIRANHIKDREKRNEAVLRSLSGVHKPQSKGLDLRGGIAFTMEVTDLNESESNVEGGVSPMDKVVEIMSERLNAFGVADASP